MHVVHAVEEDGENPEKDKDEKDKIEQAAGRGVMTKCDLVQLIPPVSAMKNVRIRSTHNF